MDEKKIYNLLEKYRAENRSALGEVKTSLNELKINLEATVSHFTQAIERMETANDEFASEISEHIIDLDVRVSALEKNAKS